MIWITPVKDRKEIDIINKTPKAYINASDLNRIENNIAFLANLHKDNYIALESLMAYYGIPEDTPGLLPTYDPDALDNLMIKTDWASSDFVLAENSERIIGNINILESIMQESEQFPKWLTVTSLDKLDLRGANNIELAIESNYHFANFTFKKYKDKIMEYISLKIRLTGKSEQSNPETNLIPVNRRKFEGWNHFDGVAVNRTQGISVPEWNTTEATQIITTGGASRTKIYYYMPFPAIQGTNPIGRKVQNRVYIKNIGHHNIVVHSLQTHSWGAYPNMKTVLPGESMQVILNGENRTAANYTWQLQFRAEEPGYDLLFVVYAPEMIRMDDVPFPDNPFPIVSAGNCDLISENEAVTMSSSVQIPWLRSTQNAADTLEYIGGGEWLYVQKVGEKVFDGTESLSFEKNSVGDFRIVWTFDKNLPKIKTVSNGTLFPGTCSHLAKASNNVFLNEISQNTNIIATASDPAVDEVRMKFIANNEFTSAQDVKAWFAAQYAAGTPVSVLYEYEEPISSVLQLGGLLKFQPETLVYTNGAIEPEISIEE